METVGAALAAKQGEVGSIKPTASTPMVSNLFISEFYDRRQTSTITLILQT